MRQELLEQNSGEFLEAFNRFDSVANGMRDFLELTVRQSQAYQYFDEGIIEAAVELFGDPTIQAVYTPKVIELTSQESRVKLPNGEIRQLRGKHFLFPFDNRVVVMPPSKQIEDAEEFVADEKLYGYGIEGEAFLSMRDIGPILSSISKRLKHDTTLFDSMAQAHFNRSLKEINRLVDERQLQKEQYREQYGEAIKHHIQQLTALAVRDGALLSDKYRRLGGKAGKSVKELRIDPEDRGWEPSIPGDFVFLWYSWKNASLIAAPHARERGNPVNKPDMSRADRDIPNRMWCLLDGVGYELSKRRISLED